MDGQKKRAAASISGSTIQPIIQITIAMMLCNKDGVVKSALNKVLLTLPIISNSIIVQIEEALFEYSFKRTRTSSLKSAW